jgi:hypothetical protein
MAVLIGGALETGNSEQGEAGKNILTFIMSKRVQIVQLLSDILQKNRSGPMFFPAN